MARIAALYDIHGNLPALDAVLDGLPQVDLIVIGGDVVWGPWPAETMDRLMSLDTPTEWIMGNADRDVFDRVEGTWKESNDWCADRLTDEQLSFLRSRPATVAVDGILFCHGSPRSDLDPITVGTPLHKIVAWCDGVEESLVVCGHTHAQFDRFVGEHRIVNAGSVGNPFEAPGAYWAAFDPGIDLRCTGYDVEGTADKIRASGFPYAERIADDLMRTSSAADAAKVFK